MFTILKQEAGALARCLLRKEPKRALEMQPVRKVRSWCKLQMDAVSGLRLLCPRAVLLPHHQEKGLGGVVLAGIPFFYDPIYRQSLHRVPVFHCMRLSDSMQESSKSKYMYILDRSLVTN